MLVTFGLGQQSSDSLPAVAVVSPPAGTQISPGDALVVDVTGGSGVVICAKYIGTSKFEVVHDGSAFAAAFTGSAAAAITGGFRYTIARVGGWLPGLPVSLEFFALAVGG